MVLFLSHYIAQKKEGVKFQKKPDEGHLDVFSSKFPPKICMLVSLFKRDKKHYVNAGRMKGLAFAYDPDRYWIEIVSRDEARSITLLANTTTSVCFYV